MFVLGWICMFMMAASVIILLINSRVTPFERVWGMLFNGMAAFVLYWFMYVG